MGWFRKMIVKIVADEIDKNGIEIGEYVIKMVDGKLLIRRK